LEEPGRSRVAIAGYRIFILHRGMILKGNDLTLS
jgi:hypothetical protein